MAKKKIGLSQEEVLQQALVPEDEQPYEVPENWVWTRLKNLRQSEKGFFDGDWILSDNMDTNGEVRLIQLSDIGVGYFLNRSSKYISNQTFDKLFCSELKQGDILISRMAEPIARSCIMPMLPYKCITAVDIAVLRCDPNIANCKYVNYLCNTSWFKNLADSLARGTTRKRITRNNLGEIPVPIPPIPEQQRIIDLIESLIEKLDQAKELIQNALDSYKNRKAAILHKAFTGELTQKWREENGVGMDSWNKTTLGKVCKSIYDGDHIPPPKRSDGIPFLVISNINKGVLSFDNTRFVSQAYFDKLSDSRKPMYGDVLYSIVGSFGIPALVDIELPFCFQRHIALFKPQCIDSRYLWYLLQTNDMYDKATKIATGTAQLTVPIKRLREIVFSLPSKHEQLEIVRILDDLFKNDQYAKEFCEVIEKIDLMKKSILSRAFRGELGTNNPMDLNGRELLNIINIK